MISRNSFRIDSDDLNKFPSERSSLNKGRDPNPQAYSYLPAHRRLHLDNGSKSAKLSHLDSYIDVFRLVIH